jgi:hypothetical protein
MTSFSRMPRYDIRNDGAGPYAIFYWDCCNREFRSQPDIANTITKDIGKSAMSGLLRKVPLLGKCGCPKCAGRGPALQLQYEPASDPIGLAASAASFPPMSNLQPGRLSVGF